MAVQESNDIALLSIHPKYAEAIMSGQKKVEFRKSAFSKSVREIVIYATSPVQKILGSFSVKNIIEDTPAALWKKYNAIGGITREDYREYYGDRDRGVAILVDSVLPLDDPQELSDFGVNVPPQSFIYLKNSLMDCCV